VGLAYLADSQAIYFTDFRKLKLFLILHGGVKNLALVKGSITILFREESPGWGKLLLIPERAKYNGF
jgi:hypothetical protein